MKGHLARECLSLELASEEKQAWEPGTEEEETLNGRDRGREGNHHDDTHDEGRTAEPAYAGQEDNIHQEGTLSTGSPQHSIPAAIALGDKCARATHLLQPLSREIENESVGHHSFRRGSLEITSTGIQPVAILNEHHNAYEKDYALLLAQPAPRILEQDSEELERSIPLQWQAQHVADNFLLNPDVVGLGRNEKNGRHLSGDAGSSDSEAFMANCALKKDRSRTVTVRSLAHAIGKNQANKTLKNQRALDFNPHFQMLVDQTGVQFAVHASETGQGQSFTPRRGIRRDLLMDEVDPRLT